MQWTEEMQLRFNELRQKELAGTLSAEEKNELAELFAVIEADEKQYLAGAMTRLREEDVLMQTQTEKRQQENMELARIISQQERLIADAQHWIAEFERRHLSIQQSFAHRCSSTAVPPIVVNFCKNIINSSQQKRRSKP
jgi:hypothetical protein